MTADSLLGPYEHTHSFGANVYLDAAGELGLTFEIISEDDAYCRIRNSSKSISIFGVALSCNDLVASRAAGCKHVVNMLLARSGVPVPVQGFFKSTAGFRIDSELDEIFNFAEGNYPVVVKPAMESGGRYVYTNIRNEDELAVALSNMLRSRQSRLLVESYLPGRVFRVLVCKGHIVDIVERAPPAVTGTGSHNVRDLVSFENASRELYGLPPILLNRRTLFHLSRQGLDRHSIPDKGQRVEISPTVSVSQGAETRMIPVSSVPVETHDMLLRAVETCGLALAGVDFISPDIMSSDPDARCGVVEINSIPHLRGHVYADRTYDLRAPIRLLELLLQ